MGAVNVTVSALFYFVNAPGFGSWPWQLHKLFVHLSFLSMPYKHVYIVLVLPKYVKPRKFGLVRIISNYIKWFIIYLKFLYILVQSSVSGRFYFKCVLPLPLSIIVVFFMINYWLPFIISSLNLFLISRLKKKRTYEVLCFKYELSSWHACVTCNSVFQLVSQSKRLPKHCARAYCIIFH